MSTQACIALASAELDEVTQEVKKAKPFGIAGARAFSLPWMTLPAPRFASNRDAASRSARGRTIDFTTRAGSWIRIG